MTTGTTDNRKLRLPPICKAHREAIEEYLTHMRNSVERTLNDHRVLGMNSKSQSLMDQIRYFRAQLATINWLLAINNQRKGK